LKFTESKIFYNKEKRPEISNLITIMSALSKKPIELQEEQECRLKILQQAVQKYKKQNGKLMEFS